MLCGIRGSLTTHTHHTQSQRPTRPSACKADINATNILLRYKDSARSRKGVCRNCSSCTCSARQVVPRYILPPQTLLCGKKGSLTPPKWIRQARQAHPYYEGVRDRTKRRVHVRHHSHSSVEITVREYLCIQTMDGDGRQGSKVSGGLAGGGTWLCYYKLLRLPGEFLVIRFFCYFPLVLGLMPYVSVVVLVFSSSFFSSVCHIPCGLARPLFLYFFRFVFFVFCFISFSLVHRMFMSCLSHPA